MEHALPPPSRNPYSLAPAFPRTCSTPSSLMTSIKSMHLGLSWSAARWASGQGMAGPAPARPWPHLLRAYRQIPRLPSHSRNGGRARLLVTLRSAGRCNSLITSTRSRCEHSSRSSRMGAASILRLAVMPCSQLNHLGANLARSWVINRWPYKGTIMILASRLGSSIMRAIGACLNAQPQRARAAVGAATQTFFQKQLNLCV
jgi:hypothetical protein